MKRVVSFYEKLPRGPAPAYQPKGLFERYLVRYAWGENGGRWRTFPIDSFLHMPFYAVPIKSILFVADYLSTSYYPHCCRLNGVWLRAALLLPFQ